VKIVSRAFAPRMAVAMVAIALGIGIMDCGGGGSHVNDVINTEILKATLDGTSETPQVTSSGSGNVDLVGNRALNTIAFDLRTQDLDGITGAFIQVGEEGSTGPVIFTLSNDSSSAAADTLGSGDLTPDPDAGINTIDDAIDAMVDGRTYVNVTTQAHPDGEIRGQIVQR